MKLLFVLPSLAGGGAEKVLIDIFKYTNYSKYSVDLCLVLNNGVYLDQIPSEVRCFYLYSKRELWRYKLDFGLQKYFFIGTFQKRRINRCIQEDYDVIVSFMEGIAVKFHEYVMDKAVKNVSWVHTDLFTKHYTTRYFHLGEERGIYQKMDKLAFVSNDAKKNFVRLFGAEVPLVTIYNPIDRANILLRAEEKSVSKTKFTICTVGRLAPQKCYDRLIRLAVNLQKERIDVDFWVIGTGSLERQLVENAIRLGVQNTIHFLGFQSNPYPYIKAADIFLSTSMTEGYPLVICEALCLGKPIVATNVTGSKEILGDSEFGLLTEQDDESIYKNTCKMILDESLRGYYARKAYRKGLDFDIKQTVNIVYNFICL